MSFSEDYFKFFDLITPVPMEMWQRRYLSHYFSDRSGPRFPGAVTSARRRRHRELVLKMRALRGRA